MFYTVYKITNTLNNRYYIGVHKTNKINDSYYGSGIIIKEAIKSMEKRTLKKKYYLLLIIKMRRMLKKRN